MSPQSGAFQKPQGFRSTSNKNGRMEEESQDQQTFQKGFGNQTNQRNNYVFKKNKNNFLSLIFLKKREPPYKNNRFKKEPFSNQNNMITPIPVIILYIFF